MTELIFHALSQPTRIDPGRDETDKLLARLVNLLKQYFLDRARVLEFARRVQDSLLVVCLLRELLEFLYLMIALAKEVKLEEWFGVHLVCRIEVCVEPVLHPIGQHPKPSIRHTEIAIQLRCMVLV